MLKSQPMASVNVTVFGHRVFADTSKFRWGCTGVRIRRWEPYKKKIRDTETDTQGGWHVMMEQRWERCVSKLRTAGDTQSWEKHGKDLPWRLQRGRKLSEGTTVLITWLQTSNLQRGEGMSLVLCHPLCDDFLGQMRRKVMLFLYFSLTLTILPNSWYFYI